MRPAFVLAFIACSALATSAPSPGPKKPASSAQSLSGWNDLRWGMTTAEVLAKHPEARPIAEMLAPAPTPDPKMGAAGREISDIFGKMNSLVLDDPANAGALFFKTSILDRLFTVSLRFRSGGLTSVTLVGSGAPDELTRTLSAKYGPPTGESVRAAIKITEWRLPKTKIELEISTAPPESDEKGASVKVVYSDATGGNAKGNL